MIKIALLPQGKKIIQCLKLNLPFFSIFISIVDFIINGWLIGKILSNLIHHRNRQILKKLFLIGWRFSIKENGVTVLHNSINTIIDKQIEHGFIICIKK